MSKQGGFSGSPQWGTRGRDGGGGGGGGGVFPGAGQRRAQIPERSGQRGISTGSQAEAPGRPF